MKKAMLHPFLLLAGLMLVVALACNLPFAAPEIPSLPSDTLTPGGTTDAPTSTDTPTPPPAGTPTGTPANMSIPPTFTSTTGVVIIVPNLPIIPIIPLVPSDTPVVLHLNYSQPPNYGNQNLNSGFVPDPFQIGMTSGGNVNVSYLGGGCSGFATSAPDLRLNYTAGAFNLLRIYFIGSQDATLIVNNPGGSYSCVGDSFGTIHPTIDFNNPVGGSYDIWVGSYTAGTYASGTLFITEASANHP
ncbi:MAG: hypothetical protein ABIJ39_03145 [Chloroflexota bacterium]